MFKIHKLLNYLLAYYQPSISLGGLGGALTSFGNSATSILGSSSGFPWGSAISAGLGFLGQRETNEANTAMSEKQMDFQREMSNTAYTRAARDLDNAGLNRILAIGSPASTPGGSMPVLGNPMTAAANSATGMSQAIATEQKLSAEIENIIQDTALKMANVELSGEQATQASKMTEQLIEQTKGMSYDNAIKHIRKTIHTNHNWVTWAQEVGMKVGAVSEMFTVILGQLRAQLKKGRK